ncbi:solute carrier family 22 member 17-like [Sinocyclocheilus grahami]|uniref:solute carrier family 22 member 17-like n=1 Tax=Sinocyclocheilus grahami TaxID=75366 RepID=UPI0007ACFCBF|nr:PREDICTED: solute carrier family 22 member 17-like [Sinocyclocheilus grahami]
MFPRVSDTRRQSSQFFRPVRVSEPGICFRTRPSSAASRLYLPSFNAFVWCSARRIERVRSAGAERRASVSAERFSLRWTERAERVQNASEPHQNHIRPDQPSSISVDVLELRGASGNISRSRLPVCSVLTSCCWQWDLVCSRYWLVPVEEVCFILGTLTGCLGLGYMADRLGRLKSLLASLMLAVVFGVLVCVSPSPPVFISMRFCLAAASAGVFLTLYVTRVELCDPSLRLLATMMSGLTVFAGELLLLAVALGCGSWRGLLGTGAAPLSLFLCYGIPGVFPESPRWLLLSERTGDMHSFSERQRDDDSFTELDTESPSSPGRPHLSFPELLHSRNIWKNLCVLGFTSFISHGISHCYSSFRGDVRGFTPSFYWTYLLSVCAGGGAWLLLWATVDRFGRRGILLLAMTLTGLASLILLGLMDYLSESAMTVFSIMGLFSSQAAASLSILFTAEVMPTIIRGSGVGAVMALGCVGRLSSPLMDLRNHYGYFLHHVVYSSLALLAVLSILLLPESKRKPLPQTLADGEQYRRPPLGRRRRDNVPLLATPNPET